MKEKKIPSKGYTKAVTKSLMNFYGQAIRSNKGDAKKMSEAAWAILNHYKEGPCHTNWPRFMVQFSTTWVMAPSYTNLSTHYLLLS